MPQGKQARLSRRQFLSRSAGVAVACALPAAPAWSRGLLRSLAEPSDAANMRRLSAGWEYFQGSLDGPWEVWNSGEIAVWQGVSLPHCFNAYDACDPDTPAYRGPGWYRTHLELANPYPNGRTLLHFGGAGQTTDIYLGDKHLAQHVGGYDEFVVDITEAASELVGENEKKLAGEAAKPAPKKAAAKSEESAAKDAIESKGLRLAVLCDNGRDLERMPSDLSDFTLDGGLYRHVSVIYLPSVSIESVHVHIKRQDANSPAEISLTGRLYSPVNAARNGLSLAIKILDPQGKMVGQSHVAWSATAVSKTSFMGEHDLGSFTLDQPALWSPKLPELYQCRVTLTGPEISHSITELFGIRTVDFPEGGPFNLNGERLLLRGTHRHEDHAGYAAAIPDDVLRKEMQLVKEMGANFIRLAHYQQSREVLDLCDELGLLVWEELSWCRSGVAGPKFQQMGQDKLHNMIDQHFNHPSVIFWGLGNEDDWPTEYPKVDKDAIRLYMGQLNELAHQLDGSRFTSFRRCDFARDIPDVYSPSIWAGWYSGVYTEYQKSLETQRKRVKRLIHIEWGADSHARRHSENPDKVLAEVATGKGTDERGLAYLNTGGDVRVSRDGDWSETYACNLFDWHLKVQETLPWFSGSAQWVFKDFTTPLRVENPVPRVNQKGVLERDMTPKEAYYVFQSYWSEVPMVRLYGHTWPVRWGQADEQKMVKVYSNCPEAELFLNGVSVGTKYRDSQDFPCAGLRWLVKFKPGVNHLRIIANPASGKPLTDEIQFTYQTAEWATPARLMLTEKSSEGSTVTLLATLVDQHGVLCLDAKHQVRFTLAGAGKLIDNRGTSSGSRVVQLYNGRAEIALLRASGDSSVAVSADGLPTAMLTLRSRLVT
jgi:beta-galactosidase